MGNADSNDADSNIDDQLGPKTQQPTAALMKKLSGDDRQLTKLACVRLRIWTR